MSTYEFTMVDSKREPTPDVRCTNVEMVDTEREPTLDVRCTNVEQHTLDAEQINSRLDGQRKPNSEVKVDEDTIDDHGSNKYVKRQKLSSQNECSNSSTYNDQNLPMTLWENASKVYVQNISPHRVFGRKTPKEAFTGVKPDVSHLRIFGCSVYIHIPKEKRSKLEH